MSQRGLGHFWIYTQLSEPHRFWCVGTSRKTTTFRCCKNPLEEVEHIYIVTGGKGGSCGATQEFELMCNRSQSPKRLVSVHVASLSFNSIVILR
jgi:hypothetical protein